MQKRTVTQNAVIQAVIFDLDGVLMDSEWVAFEEWQGIVRELGGTLPDSAFPLLTGTSAEESARQVMLASGVTFPLDTTVAEVWQRTIRRLKTAVPPMTGAKELVQHLAARGLPLAIASNSLTWYINDALHALDLDAYFPIRVSIDQVAQGKPAPDVYREAARQLHADPAICLAVEDSQVGVQAAVAAGMRVIAVPHPTVNREGYGAALRIYDTLVDVLPDLPEIMGW